MAGEIKFVEIITGIITGIIANILSSPFSQRINKGNLKKFKNQLNTWIQNFAEKHQTCNIILNDEFANYIKSRDVIKRVMNCVLYSSSKNTSKDIFIEQETKDCIKYH